MTNREAIEILNAYYNRAAKTEIKLAIEALETVSNLPDCSRCIHRIDGMYCRVASGHDICKSYINGGNNED